MARKGDFKMRLTLAWEIIKGNRAKPLQIMICERCGSEEIERLSEYGAQEDKDKAWWISTCRCKKCGATCYERQIWTWEGKADARVN